ncbi:MAG: hypothetical protein WC617_17840 [Rhodanobacter sp.]|jgi:tellurite resistance protein TehA-like permease
MKLSLFLRFQSGCRFNWLRASLICGFRRSAVLALLNDVLPERETHAARNLGIFNIASVLPQLLMPAIAPGILAASGGSFTSLFVIAATLVALGAWAILPVRGVR